MSPRAPHPATLSRPSPAPTPTAPPRRLLPTPHRPHPFACLLALACTFLCAAALAPTAHASLVISEFLAANRDGLRDEDGDATDWIELHNPSPEPVITTGWSLTDDPASPAKWVLPPRTIPPGGFLLVFASGKNRTPAQQGSLHANFRLEAAGEFLALFPPASTLPATAFTPAFPPQEDDVAYGFPALPASQSLLQGARVSVRIPTGPADLSPGWTTGADGDAAWTLTPGLPVGFDTTPATVHASTNLALAGVASQSTTGYNLPAANANDGDLNSFSHTATNDDASTWTLDLRNTFELRRIVLHNRAECCPSRLRDLTVSLLHDDASSVLWTSELLNPENQLNNPASITLDFLDLGVDPVPARFIRITRTPDPDLSGSGGAGNPDEDSVLSLAEVEVFGVDSISYAPILRTDLSQATLGRNASALVRIPFTIDNPAALSSLVLTLRHDDGVVVHLNGSPIVTRNAPDSPAWNATATAERPKAAALLPETFDLQPFLNLLRPGTNWLAFHLLNAHPDDPDLLLDADLLTETPPANLARYLTPPTPGASNNVPGHLGRVADTRFSINRGFANAPFDLAITTETPDAEIRYTLDGSSPSPANGHILTGTIRIDRTTVVRAAAFKRDHLPTNVDTHTYVFLAHTIAQPARPSGFPDSWAGLAPDYAMDPRITQAPAFAGRMTESLLALPTLSIATETDNLFGPSRGIYANPERSGLSWERPASIEWFQPDRSREFQADAGLRIQGGYFRSRNATHKHSLRLLFKNIYGPGKLRGDLFETFGATREFDTLVLRAGANDGYSWDAARDTEQFLRDEFGRRTHLAMGQVAAHGRFVHLYLNGLYWGVYNLTERPAEDFSSSYFGGPPEDWDAINSGEVKNGSLSDWNTFITRVRAASTLADYQRLKGLSPDGSPDPAAPALLDAANYIDYMLLNIWGGNWDWPNKNFWFGRDRTGRSGGFKFYLWDFENTMGNNRDRSPLEMVSPRPGITGSWVAEPHDRLRRLEEYRIEFADRVHRHCFGSGVLTPPSLIARYRQLANLLEPAVIAESARWGDDHHATPQDLTDWQRERDWLLNTYLAQRTDVVLRQLRTAGLYPSTAAPAFDPPAGPLTPLTPVTLRTTGASELFFTTNGVDPRLPGGNVHPDAVRISLPDPGPASSPDLVRSGHTWRFLADGSNPGPAWNQPAFPDTSWPAGPSPLGYGDGDETTVIPFVDVNPTQSGTQRNAASFFRTQFMTADPAAFSGLRLTLTYDDAAAVFLNGTEILRTPNLPANAGHTTYASSTSSDNAILTRDNIPASLLLPGTNTLAVQVHQSDPGSSDLSFDLELTGIPDTEITTQISGPLFFSTPTLLKARARHAGQWSALQETLYLPGAIPPSPANLVVSQFCYRPPEPTSPAERAVSTDRDDFEFLELLNISPTPLDLAGVQILGGIRFTFPTGQTLAPGARTLVVRSAAAFHARYGPGSDVAGEYQGRLANSSDSVELRDALGQTLAAFTYSDRAPWPALANEGFALVLAQPFLAPNPNLPENWRTSLAPGGTPGRSDTLRFTGTPDADSNANGQADLLDHAFGTTLLSPDQAITAGFVDVPTPSGVARHWTLSLPRNVAADDARIVIEQADQPGGPWSPTSQTWTLVDESRTAPGLARLTFRSTQATPPDARTFLRLSVHLHPQ